MFRSMVWKLVALVSLVLAVLGAILPVLPTVPFLLLAAAAASRGWPRLDAWLLSHPTYGPTIRAWRERHAVSRRSKMFATLLMAASGTVLWFTPAALWLRVGIPVGMAIVAGWLWTRPEA